MDITFPEEVPDVKFGSNAVTFVAVVDGKRVVNRVPIELLDGLGKRDGTAPVSARSGAREQSEVLELFARFRDEIDALARRAIEDGRTNASGGADLPLSF